MTTTVDLEPCVGTYHPDIDAKCPYRRHIEPIHFELGGMWENNDWEIRFDDVIHSDGHYFRPCKHCHSFHRHIEPPTKYTNGLDYLVCICPRVVVGTNEGGHNSTGICLDCILENSVGITPAVPIGILGAISERQP